jgi:phosphoribosyl 1,2-cyclic phosphodiesterase
MAPDELTAIVVTHEHGDHVGGVFAFARRHRLTVYLTHGTHAAAPRGSAPLPECRLIDGHTPFAIGSLQVQPFPVPHDAREPVQYAFSDGVRRLGVLTDSGTITPHIVDTLRACDGLVWSATTITRCSRRRAIRHHSDAADRWALWPSGERAGGGIVATDRHAGGYSMSLPHI